MNVVIIGNSAAGLNALAEFRKYDKDSQVTIISHEEGPAYSRVLLPYYLRKKVSWDHLFIRKDEDYEKYNAKTLWKTTVVDVDAENHLVVLDNGEKLFFDKLLIASGSSPVKPPIENLNGPGVYHLWTLDDIRHLDPLFKEGNKLLVLGSGFIALQGGWAALQRGLSVSVYELMTQIMPRILDEKAAEIFQNKIHSHGVDLQTGVSTTKVERDGHGKLTVYAKDKEPLEIDAIIVGTGVRANTGFLNNTKIEMNRGILVNSKMETNVPGIYAAGDVAVAPDTFGNPHISHALWPTAVEHGQVAGANLAGQNKEYTGSLNMNVTQMYGVTVASMGIFQPAEDEEGISIVCPKMEKENQYCKLVFKNDIPIGGIALGESEGAGLLGMVRPFIRLKKPLTGATALRVNNL
ncbi:MAG: FAD-dependent oxidoreductase [Clostridiales bacterium]